MKKYLFPFLLSLNSLICSLPSLHHCQIYVDLRSVPITVSLFLSHLSRIPCSHLLSYKYFLYFCIFLKIFYTFIQNSFLFLCSSSFLIFPKSLFNFLCFPNVNNFWPYSIFFLFYFHTPSFYHHLIHGYLFIQPWNFFTFYQLSHLFISSFSNKIFTIHRKTPK